MVVNISITNQLQVHELQKAKRLHLSVLLPVVSLVDAHCLLHFENVSFEYLNCYSNWIAMLDSALEITSFILVINCITMAATCGVYVEV